jgi:hypothetical protein
MASEVRAQYLIQRRVNNVHRARLHAIYKLPGFSGVAAPGIRLGSMPINNDSHIDQAGEREMHAVAEELAENGDMEIADDDMANDEVLRLGEFLESSQL